MSRKKTTSDEKTRAKTYRITKKFIDSLDLPDSSEKYGKRYYDESILGFGITIFPSGRKTFFIEYGPNSRRRRMKLGLYGHLTVTQAREEAAKRLADLIKGIDPLDVRQAEKDAYTFHEWVDQYIEDVKLRKKHYREDVRYLTRAKKKWGKRPLAKISSSDVQKAFKDTADSISKVTANRWLASVRACLQDAWRKDLISSNPAMKVKSYPENLPRDVVLNDDEFKRVLEAIDNLKDQHARAAVTLLIQTGARLSEVLRAEWKHIDFEQRTWRIPSTKSGRPQTMPIPPETIAMLKHLPRKGPYIIPGRKENHPRSDLKGPWKKIQDAAEVPHIHIHDVRRTFGLHIARKAGLHIASKLLRHTDIRVTERHYAPLGIDELRDALDRREADVIPMKKKKKAKK